MMYRHSLARATLHSSTGTHTVVFFDYVPYTRSEHTRARSAGQCEVVLPATPVQRPAEIHGIRVLSS